MFTEADHQYMSQALQQAALGAWQTSPNPSVGCVLVKAGVVIGQGHTLAAGQDHAEIQALKDCHARGLSAQGATAYVTLEPCSHFGRTPPCADRLVEAGVVRVVAALGDPNPQVSGRGLARLRSAGVVTQVGLLADAARHHHRGFLSRMERGRPWLRVKLAASLDGKTALWNGASQWITGEAARQDVHRLRAGACAMLTGIGTVLADDPRLTARIDQVSRQPARVVVDSQLRTPPSAKLLDGGQAFIIHASTDVKRMADLQDAGASLQALPTSTGRVDLNALLTWMGQQGWNEVLVEAGPALSGALIQAGLVDELVLYLAPMLLGHQAHGLVDWPPLSSLTERVDLTWVDQRMIGADLRLIAQLRP
ncbi:diaminohydroxyphosphoribosylaminopyrimidine deaminase/5-amino-6-(5-phosphoribosylamino)uracil reductase [Chitinivorax tropicus]|uniref:Riboflavin biosynthesis protein RibD n=1 Tax=Chitinivorax tropicus TaxID=714531 RepID=A0A840MLZ6_9PROT|nr:bifunctional diaminohydroxyphosphoribosylaminopyrimidine deaminase/5-amino-6-(5-phosphoribosylamino)uracil reductase RibD [Chitinivorax tropicus]MBB5020174.1 diaminohydroxyphosphoribosylaminopyrimidine deaminase/5-amino-6-(5-phosphoribosylamino)uracil reductase [Chitinivorax tropicus]